MKIPWTDINLVGVLFVIITAVPYCRAASLTPKITIFFQA